MILRDQGDLNGSAVHVVESAPPTQNSGGTSRSNPPANPTTESSRRTGSRISDTLGRHMNRVRTGRSEQNRDAQVRNRVARMENWLNQLNASITALERRTSPEESRQYISDSDNDRRNNSETGPMPVSHTLHNQGCRFDLILY